MKYRYESKKDYRDFASGRVLYNAPHTTAFPVRLASELVQICFSQLDKSKAMEGYKLYDPCCGGANLLTVIGFLFGSELKEIVATDYDSSVLNVAKRNLALLHPDGLAQRKKQLQEALLNYGKESHKEALISVERLSALQTYPEIKVVCKQRDITSPARMPISGINIIITDLPYGNVVQWQGNSENPLRSLFENLYKAVDIENSIVAIVADKKQKLVHERFARVKAIKAGKRQIAVFKPLS